MRSRRVVANIQVCDIGAAQGFYQEFLGLGVQEFDLGWVSRFSSPDSDASIQLVTRDATSAEDSVVSVTTDDVDAAYQEALDRGYEIVRPLSDEEWGVRRFLVRAPDGTVVNIVRHHD